MNEKFEELFNELYEHAQEIGLEIDIDEIAKTVWKLLEQK